MNIFHLKKHNTSTCGRSTKWGQTARHLPKAALGSAVPIGKLYRVRLSNPTGTAPLYLWRTRSWTWEADRRVAQAARVSEGDLRKNAHASQTFRLLWHAIRSRVRTRNARIWRGKHCVLSSTCWTDPAAAGQRASSNV